ncbi:hypothetical protein NL371_26470, partial [Klebsiella pneumoniae]|nr:hypothetical protein [Klebsiella pneumoniae]
VAQVRAARPDPHLAFQVAVVSTLASALSHVTSLGMCNRYRMTAKQAELGARYGVDPIYPEDVTFPPPEIFPDRSAFVVRQDDRCRRLDTM